MEVKAVAKYIRISPQKARLVADVIRGMDAGQALTTLRFMPKKGAAILRKVLESAVANADQNDTVDVDTLYVKRILIDGGPQQVRFARDAMLQQGVDIPMFGLARGRANRILKRSSHITVVVDER